MIGWYMVRYLGIDIGSTSINCVVIDEKNNILFELPYRRHFSLFSETVVEVLEEIYNRFSPEEIHSVSFTGSNGRRFSEALGAPFYWDPQAQCEGVLAFHPEARAVISFGGQDAALLLINEREVERYLLNSSCAAGTGSFIEVQALRMFETAVKSRGIDGPEEMIEEALRLFIEEGETSTQPVPIATRCTVFAKTDIIHWSNANKPRSDIIAGIIRGLVHTYVSDLVKDTAVPADTTVLVGGGALNPLLVRFFKKQFPGLLPAAHPYATQAFGAARLAGKAVIHNKVVPEDIKKMSHKDTIARTGPLSREFSPIDEIPLSGAAQTQALKTGELYLGIDVGSTTTKCALLSFRGPQPELIHKEYIKTEGRPIEAAKSLLRTIYKQFGDGIELSGSTATGSGRYPVGQFVGADYIINEITAHALAAVRAFPKTDTVFELGGQDSKYISLKNGYPVDFNMNKICSAGTGSFLEEMAEKLEIDIIEKFETKALLSEAPVKLGDRCTVFMESGVASAQQQGAEIEDVCAGLALAVAENFINRVVEMRRIGEHIMFLGGPSRNRAVVGAFRNITGADLFVPAHSEVFGAIGAAFYAREHTTREHTNRSRRSRFRGFGIVDEKLTYTERVCTVPDCSNSCTLQVYKLPDHSGPEDEETGPARPRGAKTLIFGDRCGRYEPGPPGVSKGENYFTLREKIFSGAVEDRKHGSDLTCNNLRGTTVILPAHLFMHQFGPLFHRFFLELGVTPVWQRNTTAEMIDRGINITPPGFCFSKIVSTGHIACAVKQMQKHEKCFLEKCFLWIPTMIDMPVEEEDEPGMFCPWTQASYYTLQHHLGTTDKRNILSPVIHLNAPFREIVQELHSGLKPVFSVSRSRVARALSSAFSYQEQFEHDVAAQWSKVIEPALADAPAMVVVGRPYMLYDTELNLHIGREIARLGAAAIPMDFLPIKHVSVMGDYHNMYWGQGARIIRAVRFCALHPNLFPVVISNFGCGPDSFLSKYVEEEMEKQGRKPLLEIELDAHSARAGMVTRLEAFFDVITSYYNLGSTRSRSTGASAKAKRAQWQYQEV
jgi:predicted CoA-substrate-specific enzyme activase